MCIPPFHTGFPPLKAPLLRLTLCLCVLLHLACGRKWRSPTETPEVLPTEGLVAWYPFNGNANDESGNGNDGTVYGAALIEDRFGISDKAYSFNGRDNYIIVNSSSSLQPTKEITIAVWLFPLSYPTDAMDGWMGILTKRINENNAPWDSYVISIHKEQYLQFGVNGASDALRLHNMGLYKWIFALGTMSENEVKFYINGRLQSRISRGDNILYSSLSLRIGTLSITRLNPFNGIIDDIRIYNRALSDREILTLYHENGWGYGQ